MSRRAKSVDIAHFSSSLIRMPSRIGGSSIVSRFTLQERPKTPRSHSFGRYTRHGARHLKPQQTEFHIRTSVADLVMKELENFDRCIFYQRVYILAKNVTLTASCDSSVTSILDKYMHSKTSLHPDDGSVEEQVAEEGEAEVYEMELDEYSQMAQKSEGTYLQSELQTKTSKEGPLLQLTRADFETVKEKRIKELDFFDEFKDKIDHIVKRCDSEQLSEDRFTGLLLCMGNSHTLLVLEGTEDTIAFFCEELLHISNQYFEIMRIFLVEDRIEETYFDDFLYRRSVAMNINEKFPPPTANDPQLMGSQHWLIKEKIRFLCQTLSTELRPKTEPVAIVITEQPVIQIIEEEKRPSKRKPKPKRKKSPKRPKSPTTQVAAQTVATQPVRSSNVSERSKDASREALEEEGSVHSIAIGSDSSAKGLSTIEAEVTEHPSVEILPPSEPIVEETVKTEEIIVQKEHSMVKLDTIATILGEEPSMPEEVEEELTPKEILSPFALDPVIYNRLLPEIQRIELVLTSKRFYLDVKEFVRFSQEIPVQPDEDAIIWPTSYSYLPLNVFERLPFDVNLTFGNYDVKENEEGDTDSSDEEGKEGEDDGDKGDKKET